MRKEGAKRMLEQLPIKIPNDKETENQKREYDPKIIRVINGIKVVKLVNKVLRKDSFTDF